MPRETTVGAAAVLSRPHDPSSVLLTRRSENKRNRPGAWELGLEIEDLALLYVDCSEHDRRHIVFVYQGQFREDQLCLPSWEVSEARIGHPWDPLPEPVFPRVAEELQYYVRARSVAHAHTLDLGQRPLEGPYDLVVSLQVLHHIADVDAQIAALARVVAEGGALGLCALEAAGLRVVSSTTPYVNRKVIGGEERLFPVFLVVGRR